MGAEVKPVPRELLAHFEEMLKFDKPRSEAELRLLFDAVPALVAEVRVARSLLSAPRWSGVITAVDGNLPKTRIGPAGHSVPDRDRAASMMLAALGRFLRCHDRCGIDCEHDKAQAAVTAALDAGIEPAK